MKAAQFAAVAVILAASHDVADHWVQTDRDAVAKGDSGWPGRFACGRHVASYIATQALALTAANQVLGLGLRPGRAAAALAISAATHYVADRQGGHWQDENPRSVVRLAARTGHAGWLQRDPGAGYLLDQSFHKGCLLLAAAVAAR